MGFGQKIKSFINLILFKKNLISTSYENFYTLEEAEQKIIARVFELNKVEEMYTKESNDIKCREMAF